MEHLQTVFFGKEGEKGFWKREEKTKREGGVFVSLNRRECVLKGKTVW